jgi:hypothetical protein
MKSGRRPRCLQRAQWLPERIELMQWWANHLQTLRGVPTPLRGSHISADSRQSLVALARRQRRDASQTLPIPHAG